MTRRIDMSDVLSSKGLDLLFRGARTHNAWLDKPVEDALLKQVYDLAKMGPTSANMCPMRIIFVKSREAKERLKPALLAGNVDKTMKAPVTAIIGMDVHFYEKLPKLFPHADARSWFKDLPENVLEYTRASVRGTPGTRPRPGRRGTQRRYPPTLLRRPEGLAPSTPRVAAS
jgi:nitroreductase